MRLFLIRHGETVDNVAGVYAGITDSALTSHGLLQARRLGRHLAQRGVSIAHLFASDRARALKTAAAVRDAQPPGGRDVVPLLLLREQDFGSYEGKSFAERARGGTRRRGREGESAGFRDVETKEAMRARTDAFVQDYLVMLFETLSSEESVVVVAHGIILSHLWRSIMCRFPPAGVSVAPGASAVERPLDLMHLGMWSNTGFLELEVKVLKTPSSGLEPMSGAEAEAASIETAAPPKVLEMALVVKAVNSLEHLKGLKKTRGGIGSLKHDEGQKTIESFFKKRKMG